MSPVFANRTTPWWDGSEVYGADQAKSCQLREGAKLRLLRRVPAQGRQGLRDHRLQRELVAGARRAAHPVRARAQPALRRAARPLPGLERRADLPDGAADRLRADRQDPHHGVDPGDPRHRDHRHRPEEQLVRPSGARLAVPSWVIWLIDSHASVGIPKTMPDHNGVPYSLTEDFVTVYRMHPLLPDDYRFADHRTGAALGRRAFLDIQGANGRRGTAGLRPGEHAVLLRPVLPRRDHPAQLPAVAAEVRAQRRDDRPVGRGSGAHPPPRRAPLQRLPCRAAQAADQALGRALRRTRSRCAG